MPYKSIVLKIGTNVLTKDDCSLDISLIERLTKDISELHLKGIRMLVITSGSIGAGRALMPKQIKGTEISKRQVLSSIGQAELMSIYKGFFDKKDIRIAQLLPTKLDFKDRIHYLNIKRCLDGLWENKVIPIINENDTVSVRELMFTDNDELAGLIAGMVSAEALVIATNVEGIFDGSPNDPRSKLLCNIDANKNADHYVSTEKSSFGRGGMLTKISIAQKTAKLGTDVFILNGKKEGFLNDVITGNTTGTKIPAKREKSNKKKWLAFSGDEELAFIKIDRGLSNIIAGNDRIVSILPVGVIAIEGEFEKGDLLEIRNINNEKIGVGMAQYSSETAKKNMGITGKKPLILYDNLYLF